MHMKHSSKIDQLLFYELDPAYRRRARLVLESLQLTPATKVLDVGSGRGFYLQSILELSPKTAVFGIDKNPSYVAIASRLLAKTNAKISEGDATNLPFTKGSMDVVICSELLEHVPDDVQVLHEIFRVLKPGGRAILTVPSATYPFLWDPINWVIERFFGTHVPAHIWWLAGIWADHVRLYTKTELEEKILQAKFNIHQLWECTTFCMPMAHFLLYGIGKNIVELGWLKEFNRFEHQTSSNQQPSIWFRICRFWVDFWDKKNEHRETDRTSCVNLVVIVQKPVEK